MDLAAGLQTIVTAVLAVPGVETASTDASQVTAPGALVKLVSCEPVTLDGWALDTQVLLVVTDSDGGPGPAAALSVLLSNCLTAGVVPDGPVLAVSVQLPSNPAPLPGLLLPITVRIPA